MSYLLPTFSGPAGALAQDPAPLVTVNGQRLRIGKVHPTEGITFDRLGAEPAEGQAETVIESACGMVGGTFADLAAVVAHMENPPAPTLTAAEAEALLDHILDEWAAAKGYASAARCITYSNDPDPTFSAEGVAMLNARSAVWVAARAAVGNPETPPFTEAGVRAFAAPFAPYWIMV